MRGLSFPLLFNKPSQSVVAVAATPPVAGYTVWYDASDLASITHIAGAVSQWNDKSGNLNHLVQVTAAKKPTTGITTINGLNVLSFDGGDGLTVSLDLSATNKLSIFVVFTAAVGGAGQMVLEHGAVSYSVSNSFMLFRQADDFMRWVHGSGGIVSEWTTSSAVTTTPSLVSSTHDRGIGSSQTTAWLNGAVNGSRTVDGNPTGFFPNATLNVGSRADGTLLLLTGKIAEIVIYSSILGTVNRQSVEAYLKAKWATP